MSIFKHRKQKTRPNTTSATSSKTFGPKIIHSVQRKGNNSTGFATWKPTSQHPTFTRMPIQRNLEQPESNVNWSLSSSQNTLHRSLEGGRTNLYQEEMLAHRKPSQHKNIAQLQRSLRPKQWEGKPKQLRGSNNVMQLKAAAQMPLDSLQPARSGEVLQRDKDPALTNDGILGEADIELDKDDVNVVANGKLDQQEGVPQGNIAQDVDDQQDFPQEGEQETTTTLDEDDEWDDNTTDPTPKDASNANNPNPALMGKDPGQNNVGIITHGGFNNRLPGQGKYLPRQNKVLEFGNFYGSGTINPLTLEELYKSSLRKLIKKKFKRSISIYKSSKEIRIVDRMPRRRKEDSETRSYLAKQTNSFYQDIKNYKSYQRTQQYIAYKTKVKPSNIGSRATGVGINSQTNETEPLYHYETSIKLTMPSISKWKKGLKEFFKGAYQSTVGANQSDATDVATEVLTAQDGYTIYDRVRMIIDLVRGKGGDIPDRVSELIAANDSFWTWAAPGLSILSLIKNFLDIRKYWRRRKKLKQAMADSETELAKKNLGSQKKNRLVKLQESIKYGIHKLKILCWTTFVNAFSTFVQLVGRILTMLIPPAALGTVFTDVLATVVKLASFAVRKTKGLIKYFKGTRGKQRLVSAKAMFDSALHGDAAGIAAIRALDAKSCLDVLIGHSKAGAKKLGKGIGTTVAWPFTRYQPTMKLNRPLDERLSKKGKDQMQWGRWPTGKRDFKTMLANINASSARKDTFVQTLANQIKSSV